MSNLLSHATGCDEFCHEDEFLLVLELDTLSDFKIYHIQDALVL